MASLRDDLTELKTIEQGLKDNKVANFAYEQSAYDNNNANGVDLYNFDNAQNIPSSKADVLQTNNDVLNKGFRSQTSSIPRMLINHFFGRISYNLNKVNDIVYSLLEKLIDNIGQPNGLAVLDNNGVLPVENGGTGNNSVDAVPTAGSTKMVTSDGIKSYVDNREVDISKLTGILPVENGGTGNSSVDTVPTAGSTKMVTSDGIRTVLDNLVEVVNKVSNLILGKVWQKSLFLMFGEFKSIIFANNIFVANSSSGNGLYYSENGKTWTQSNVTSIEFNSIIFANNIFVAGSINKGLYYSEDGKTWTPSNITSGSFDSIIFTNNIFVAGSAPGYHDAPSTGLYYSEDGKTWTQSNVTSGIFNSIIFNNNIFVAGSKSNNGLYYSEDGKTWTQSTITSGNFNSATFANNIFVAGSSSNKGLYYSEDGKTWTQSNIISGSFSSIIFDNNVFVAGSDSDSDKGVYYSGGFSNITLD